MTTTTLENKYEVDNIIKKTLNEMVSGSYRLPFYANDSAVGTGHAYKYHRSSPLNSIWPTVLEKLHNLGLKEWALTSKMDYSDPSHPTPAKWIGIRSARLPRR
jgi:hypothetical protein